MSSRSKLWRVHFRKMPRWLVAVVVLTFQLHHPSGSGRTPSSKSSSWPPRLAEEIIATHAVVHPPPSRIPKYEDTQGLATRSGELPSPPMCPSAAGSSCGSASSSESKTLKGVKEKRNLPKDNEQKLRSSESQDLNSSNVIASELVTP